MLKGAVAADLLRRAHLLKIGYAAFGLLLFIVFLAATFPYDQALSSALGQLGLRIEHGGRSVGLPLGARFTGVRLRSTVSSADPPLVESPELTVAPYILGLLGGRAGIRMAADIYEGELRATISQSGAGLRVNFDFRRLNLARVPALKHSGVDLAGLLSGTGSAVLGGTDWSAASAQADLAGDSLALSIVPGSAPMAVGQVTARLGLERAVLTIKGLEASGPDLKLTGQGKIWLAPELAQSTVDLTIAVDLTTAGRSHLGFLLALLPHPPEPQRPYRVRGPIVAPLAS